MAKKRYFEALEVRDVKNVVYVILAGLTSNKSQTTSLVNTFPSGGLKHLPKICF